MTRPDVDGVLAAIDSAEPCGLCSRPATGHAQLNGQRYCHGDGEPEPTCYQVACWRSQPNPSRFMVQPIDESQDVW